MTAKELQELARQERNKYAKEWRKNNPNKVKAANQRYWERKAAKRREEVDGADNGKAD